MTQNRDDVSAYFRIAGHVRANKVYFIMQFDIGN